MGEHNEKHKGVVLEVTVEAKPGWGFQSQKQVLGRTHVFSGKRKTIIREYQGIAIRTVGGGAFSGVAFDHLFGALMTLVVFWQGVELLAGFVTMYFFRKSSSYWFD